jgi:5-methylcytosine-specific restriction endonuclease McrA
MGKKITVSDDEIIIAATNHLSATSAAASLGIQYGTFRKHATRLGVFRTNQSGIGISKPISDKRKIPLNEILEGKHPQYQSNKLRKRLLEANIKEHRCEVCGITEWCGHPVPLELDHIDGVRENHILSNIRLVCSNCHAQTDTFRGKNTRI